MFEKNSIEQFLKKLSAHVKSDVKLYLIGGGNMSLKGLKDATKDIDIVLETHKELKEIKNALEKLGYKIDESLFQAQIYKNVVFVFFDKTGSRIDLFVDVVSSQLRLSNEIRKRASEYKTFDKLKIFLVANEDIFLFKSLTDREHDIADCRTLIDNGLDWDIILKECVSQHRKEIKWIFWIYEQLCRIEEIEKIPIPQKSKFFKVCLSHWDKKPEDWMVDFSDDEIKKHIPKKYQSELLKPLKEYRS